MKRVFVLILLLCSWLSAEAFDTAGYSTFQAPEVQSYKSTSLYLWGRDLDTSHQYFLKESTYTEFYRKISGLTVVWLFNKDGNMVRYTPGPYTCADPSLVLKQLSPAYYNKSLPNVTSFNIKDSVMPFIQSYRKYKEEPLPDYTVIVFWTKYSGMYAEGGQMDNWQKIINDNETGVKIKVWYVNLEPQYVWSKEVQDKVLNLHTRLYNKLQESLAAFLQYGNK